MKIHFKHILIGIKNFILKKDPIEEMSKRRYEICKQCEYKTTDKNKCVIAGECCSICGCNLSLKTRTPEEYCALYELQKQPKWDSEEL